MTGVSLADLKTHCPGLKSHGDMEVRVRDLHHDSREVGPGELFVGIPGASHDGATFVAAALQRGAVAVLANRRLDCPCPVLWSEDVRAVFGVLAQRVHGDPTKRMKICGVTGTNGKTTVAHLLAHILRAEGARTALMGTIGNRGPGGALEASFTTPEADALARFCADQLAAGADTMVMEVSSHALAQRRVDGMQFEVAAFVNLSQDHLDFHGDMPGYERAKGRLFLELEPRTSVICLDSEAGRRIAADLSASQGASRSMLRLCSLPDAPWEADIRVTVCRLGPRGVVASLQTPWGPFELRSTLLGAHNLQNLLVAFACAVMMGVPAGQAVTALATAPAAPGRLEPVIDPRGTRVLVDYAHTPEALERVLHALRPNCAGRLLVLAGCGGDRDTTKRAPMGQAAVGGADLAILTSDNPRGEEPRDILEQMRQGAEQAGSQALTVSDLSTARSGHALVVDRRDAIHAALAAARPEDTVLIAGKGHEDYQIVKGERRDFDDRLVAAEALRALGEET